MRRPWIFSSRCCFGPHYAIALLNLGNVYRRQHEFDKAEECLTAPSACNRTIPRSTYSLGMLYAQQNRIEPASDYLEKAITLRPDYGEALNNLGIVFVRAQNYA